MSGAETMPTLDDQPLIMTDGMLLALLIVLAFAAVCTVIGAGMCIILALVGTLVGGVRQLLRDADDDGDMTQDDLQQARRPRTVFKPLNLKEIHESTSNCASLLWVMGSVDPLRESGLNFVSTDQRRNLVSGAVGQSIPSICFPRR